MEHRISILFYVRNSKKTREGLAPIYIRITVNGHRLEQSVQRLVDPAQWSAAAGRLKGNTNHVRQLNLYLDTLSSKVLQMEREMVMDGVAVNFSNFREKWLGLTEPVRLLLDVFQQHNDQMAALIRVGKDFCPATLDRYNTCRDHVRAYIQWKYKTADIDIKRLDYDFVDGLEFWLKAHRNCAHNTTLKYISNLKKIVNGCIRKGWLTRDPFAGFKRTKQEMEREALTEMELERINAKTFATDRLNIARHTFATTVTLSNGVPIESVSKMLGHRNLKTTQHYARVLDRKLSEDMRALQVKFNTENRSPSVSHSDTTP